MPILLFFSFFNIFSLPPRTLSVCPSFPPFFRRPFSQAHKTANIEQKKVDVLSKSRASSEKSGEFQRFGTGTSNAMILATFASADVFFTLSHHRGTISVDGHFPAATSRDAMQLASALRGKMVARLRRSDELRHLPFDDDDALSRVWSRFNVLPRFDPNGHVYSDSDEAEEVKTSDGFVKMVKNERPEQTDLTAKLLSFTEHVVLDETQSPHQLVTIMRTTADPWAEIPDHYLYLDGTVQSSTYDEVLYHNTLVHPALLTGGPDRGIERALIIGGGEGGTLREVLKYKSLKEVVMVDLDAQVIESSRKHLKYNNCTGFGTSDCFEDPRLTLYTEDAFAWMETRFGKGVKEVKDGSKFDAIILDLIDVEELPEGAPFAEYLYSDEFFQCYHRALVDQGVMSIQLGVSVYDPGDDDIANDVELLKLSALKFETLDSIATYFDMHLFTKLIPTFGTSYEPWTFVVAWKYDKEDDVENASDEDEDEEEYYDVTTYMKGKENFYAAPPTINRLIVERIIRLPNGNYDILFDGQDMPAIQYDHIDGYLRYFCYKHESMCERISVTPEKLALDANMVLEIKETKEAGLATVFSKDVPAGTLLGWRSSESGIIMPQSHKKGLDDFVKETNSKGFRHLNEDYLDFFGYDIDPTSYACDLLSPSIFTNHACNSSDANVGPPPEFEVEDAFNPLSQVMKREYTFLITVLKDVKAGDEMLTDYSALYSGEDKKYFESDHDKWCNGNHANN